MSKTVTLQLSETEYRTLVLCYTLGDLIKDSIEQKSEAELQAQMQLHQKLDKAAYEAKLTGSGYERGIYYYGQDIEEEMLTIYEDFKEYISSGEEASEMEQLRQQIEAMERREKKK